MQAAAHNGKYDIVRQAGMDLVKIHHDLENEKPPRPIVQKPAPPLNYQQSPPTPLTPSPLAQESVPPLNSQQLPPNPLSSPFQLAQKCAPTPPQVQNPALKCARPFLSGFKMRAACAPRCANFPKNPIFSPKTRKTAIFDNTPRQTPLENPAPHDTPAPKPLSPCRCLLQLPQPFPHHYDFLQFADPQVRWKNRTAERDCLGNQNHRRTSRMGQGGLNR